MSEHGPGPFVMSAKSLIGDQVKNMQDEDLGAAEEIMIDMMTGKVAYVVVGFGGFLGIGEKYFAVPFSAFTLDTGNHCLRLDADKSRLENAEGFDKDDWPDFADQSWQTRVHDYYGAAYFWA